MLIKLVCHILLGAVILISLFELICMIILKVKGTEGSKEFRDKLDFFVGVAVVNLIVYLVILFLLLTGVIVV